MQPLPVQRKLRCFVSSTFFIQISEGKSPGSLLPSLPHPGLQMNYLWSPCFLQGVPVHFPHFWGSWIHPCSLMLCGEASGLITAQEPSPNWRIFYYSFITFFKNYFVVFKVLKGGVGSGGWWSRGCWRSRSWTLLPWSVSLVQHPLEIPSPALPPSQHPETFHIFTF